MIRSPRPSVAPESVFADCCATIRDTDLRRAFLQDTQCRSAAAAAYATLGNRGELGRFDSQLYRPSVTQEESEWLYKVRLVGSKKGRTHYESIRDGNNGRCSLCNVRDATTLDHHLPISRFPALAVTPDNLLPACSTCNHTKLDRDLPVVHSYFDELGPERWLTAQIVESTPFVILYTIRPPQHWPADLTTRAKQHFALFDLSALYAKQAIRLLVGMRSALTRLHDADGADSVRAQLSELARSFWDAEPNGWEAAALSACSESAWFCDVGFRAGI